MNKELTFSAKDLSVLRGDRFIFENLEFQVKSGQLLKLVGPNGSGKSSLLKTLTGFITPINGLIESNDDQINGDHEWISKTVCYLGHKNALKNEFTVFENLEFWANLWNTNNYIDDALSAMGIEYLRDTQARFLSSGQTRRAAIARCLCHPAQIWLFDEPTVGLDEHGLKLLAKTMTKHLEKGGIILCATHVDLGINANLESELNLADFRPKNANGNQDLWVC